jgi:RHS repeat-associated protein
MSRLSWLLVLLALAFCDAARAALVGRIDGELTVGARGAAIYSVPIVVPPGTAGAQPALALVYDSQAPNGAFGVGFGVSGLSSIARCPMDLARDGERRAVRFDARDPFCLDGERLVRVSGTHGAPGAEYRTERDGFARVRVLSLGPASFEVVGRDGVRRFYGTTPDSRVEAQGRAEVRVWALARTEDPAGNAVRYSYFEDATRGEFALARIDYTENASAGLAAYASVRFALESRPDPHVGFAAGSRISSTLRVARVETWLGEERVREYRLDYERSPGSGRSRVASLTLCGLDDECLPPTRFVWDDAPAGWDDEPDWDPPRQLWRDAQQEGVLADVDGDGRIDLVHGGSASQGRETWLNDGGGFDRNETWRVPDDLFGETRGNPRALLVDLNGDDLPDYVRAYRRVTGAIEIATHLNVGNGWSPQASADWSMPSFLFDYANDQSRQLAQLSDVDGDGLLDWVQAYEGTEGGERRDTRINTGSGFGPTDERWALPARLWSYENREQRAEAALVDLDGDGLPDLIRACATAASGDQLEVWLNTGSGFTGPIARWRPPHVLWDYATVAMLRQKGELADVNGDGLPDFVVAYTNSAGSLRAETWLNTGAGWLRDADWDLPTHLWSYEDDKHRQTAQLLDVNGDGLLDVVQAHVTASGAERLQTWLNTGHGFPGVSAPSEAWAPPREVWSYNGNGPRTKGTFSDVNGDGGVDFVRAYRAASLNVETHLGRGHADRIRAVDDGLGGRVELEYAPLSDPAVHVAGERAQYPQASVRDARSVVRRAGAGARASELRWTSHRYGELRADRRLGIELGFAWHEARDEGTGVASVTHHAQTWPLQGFVVREEKLASVAGGTRLLERKTHDLRAVSGAATGSFAVRAVSSREERWELDGGSVADVRTTREFDAYGNVTRERVELGDGFERTTERVVRNDPSRWLLGLVERSDVTARGPGESPRTRSFAQRFDPTTGLVIQRTNEPDRASLRVATTLARDRYGNEIARTVRGPDFEARATSMLYDWRGRFAELEIDALGHASVTARDARFGLPIAQLGPDPTVPQTRFAYDGLGRLVSTTRVDGVTTTVSRSACDADCPDGAAVAVRSSTPGAPAVTLYLDALGRELRRETDGFDGRVVRVDLALDLRGLVTAQTRPYFAGDGPYTTSYERDVLGRPTRVVAPDGAETRWSYGAREVRTTDALGRTTLTRRDARGNVSEVVDALGSVARYAWDAWGNLVRARDPLGNETRHAYDELGRRVASADPDLGAASFAYDALGQLVEQVDARGTRARLSYDALGRLIRREGDGPTAIWVWDRADHGVGKLARVETPDGAFAREVRYDAYGREASSSTRIGRDRFELARTYDAQGRAASLRYPTGFTIAYAYTATGHLESVRGASGGPVFWRAESRAADGRVERERLGNGLATDRIFDPRSGRLAEIETIGAGGGSVQALIYAWDLQGNLTSRDDAISGRRETFGYDALDRITRATLANAGTTSFAYDAIGNLAYKTGVGAYAYPAPGEPRPHAVERVGDDPRRLQYDASGNLVGDPAGRALAWSARNQPIAIASSGEGGGYEFLSYGPEGDLIHRLDIPSGAHAPSTFTLQLGDDFERSTNLTTGRVEHRHLVHAEGALVAVHVTRSTGAPETRYAHRDHLESVVAMSSAAGAVLERVGYDVFGAGDALPTVAPRGYTGHVSLARSKLVHMRGRVYDPRLGRFLSPDPVAAPGAPAQALDRYGYVASNPLRFVDPSGFLAEAAMSSGGAGGGGSMPALYLGVSAAGSFLSDLWGNIRFGASAIWNGIGWLGSQLYDGAQLVGGAVVAGAMWAWRSYNSFSAGLLPDARTPFGLVESAIRGLLQPDDPGTLYYVGKGDNGEYLPPVPHEGPFTEGNLFANGQCLDVEQAALKGSHLFEGQPFYMLHAPTVNLVSDTIESFVLKLRPSALSRQLARILDGTTGSVNLVGYSQGALQVYWGLTLAETKLPNVTVSLFGPAISSISYEVALRSSGAQGGGYFVHWNDLVPNLAGGNFTGGWLLPVLLPARIAGSVLFAPTLFSEEHSVHGSYAR